MMMKYVMDVLNIMKIIHLNFLMNLDNGLKKNAQYFEIKIIQILKIKIVNMINRTKKIYNLINKINNIQIIG